MLPSISSFPISDLVTLGFYFMAFIYIIFSIIFHYHWKEYGTDAKVTKITLVFYFSSTLPLILLLGIMTLII